MRMLQQHEGRIYVRTGKGDDYGATVAEFFNDSSGTEAPRLPAGITGRIYEPGIRHALIANDSVVDGGPMPWREGDELLARYSELMARKQAREKAAMDEMMRAAQEIAQPEPGER